MKDNWDHIISCWCERQLRPHYLVVGMKDNWDHILLVGIKDNERQLRPLLLLVWKTIVFYSLVWKIIETILLVVGVKDNWDHISTCCLKDNWDQTIETTLLSCWYERQLRPHFYLLVWKTIETTLLVVGMKDNWDHISTCWYERQLRPHY